MAFEATKKEWCELYSFFRLLADGKVVLGTAEAKAGDTFWPVAMIQREEHDGTRQYYIEEDAIRIEAESGTKFMPREDFGIVADLIARVERERPVIRNLYISVCIDVMRIRIRISHRITVNRLRPIFTDIKRIAKTQ